MNATVLSAATDIAATFATGAPGKVDAAARVAATEKSVVRQPREETSVELSALGRSKSALSEAQIAATRLAEHGANVGAANAPSASTENPDNRQTEQQLQAAAQQNLAAQNSRVETASGKVLDGGVLAYQRIFSL